ncbi:restriction endonuclease subunit S [Campylobacter upsaliensis]|nr:restriction endonuclease subunit S [Campylobacter upsaliensis]
MRVYKPSGIKWLGEIPHHWEIKKAKGIFKEVKRSVKDNDEIITCFRDGIVTLRKNRRTEGFTNSLKEIGYQGIRVNDLVIHSMDAFAGAIGVSDSNGKATPVYVVCVPRYDNLADNKYYAYLLRNVANSGFILSLAKGIRERSTEFKYNDFADLKIPLPPLQEQKEIAEFLDKKCEKIQNYIDKKQKLITLLQEKKQALINEVVTKGLNPNIEFKNSGIAYLGLIPHHWEVKKLKHICKINPQTNETLPNNFVYIDLESVAKGQLLKEQTINKEQAPSRAQRILQKQDILFQLVRPYQRNNYIFNKNGDYVASTGYAQIRTKECVNFVYYALLENSFVERVILKSTGSNYPAITSNDFADLKIPLPPLQEQKQIANFLDEKCEKINSAIEKTKKQIELIKEYKNTLINEAVCGRINFLEGILNE